MLNRKANNRRGHGEKSTQRTTEKKTILLFSVVLCDFIIYWNSVFSAVKMNTFKTVLMVSI